MAKRPRGSVCQRVPPRIVTDFKGFLSDFIQSELSESLKKFDVGFLKYIEQSKNHRRTGNSVVNTNITPFIPDGLELVNHSKMGDISWDPLKFSLYVSEKQRGWHIKGDELRKELGSRTVANACILDHLLMNLHLIPEEWKGFVICFWATIYRSEGNLCVRNLYWNNGRWGQDYEQIDTDWGADELALVLNDI
ncbi:MAG: hypothetical protein WCO84_03315 [bacterium]